MLSTSVSFVEQSDLSGVLETSQNLEFWNLVAGVANVMLAIFACQHCFRDAKFRLRLSGSSGQCFEANCVEKSMHDQWPSVLVTVLLQLLCVWLVLNSLGAPVAKLASTTNGKVMRLCVHYCTAPGICFPPLL